MADQTAAPPFNEQEFQRWVVTSPWFSDLASARGLDTDEMKAMLARQIFNDPEYDFRGLYTHDLSPTMNGDNIVLPRIGPTGSSFLSPDAQIGDFFNTRFGVPAAFFGGDTESALQNASALGLLPGYSVPGGGDDSPGVDRTSTFADSLRDYSTSNPVTGDVNLGPTADPTNPLSVDLSSIGFDPSRIGFDPGQMFSRENLTREGINFAASAVGNAIAGPFGGALAGGVAQYGQGRSTLGAFGSALGSLGGAVFGGPLVSVLGGFVGGRIGDALGGRDVQGDIRGTTQGTFSGGGFGLDANGNPVSGSNYGTIGPNGVIDSTSSMGGGSYGSNNNDRGFADSGQGYGGAGGFGNDSGGFSGSHSNDDNASDHNSTPGW